MTIDEGDRQAMSVRASDSPAPSSAAGEFVRSGCGSAARITLFFGLGDCFLLLWVLYFRSLSGLKVRVFARRGRGALVHRLAVEECFTGLASAQERHGKGRAPALSQPEKDRKMRDGGFGVKRQEAAVPCSLPCSSSPTPCDVHCIRSDQLGAANLAPESPSGNTGL